MGYVFVTSPCFACRKPFSYNPNKVPSITVQGTRVPICLACVKRANPLRVKNFLPEIVPLPGAYEPADETEIIWGD